MRPISSIISLGMGSNILYRTVRITRDGQQRSWKKLWQPTIYAGNERGIGGKMTTKNLYFDLLSEE